MKIPGDPLAVLDNGEPPETFLQASGVDRRTCNTTERFNERNVLLSEASRFLGQVEVPEGFSPRRDWHPEKRTHRGMVGWKTVGIGVFRDLLNDDGSLLPDDRPEHAVARGQCANAGRFLLGQTGMAELGQNPMLAKHTQRPVPGTRGVGRLCHQPIKHPPEIYLTHHSSSRLDQGRQPVY